MAQYKKDEDGLTERQRAWVLAFIGEANFNGTEAARIAGYKTPQQAGSDNRRNPIITNEIKKHLDEIKWQGLAHRSVRIEKLMRMIDDIEIHEQRLQTEAKYDRDLWQEKRQILAAIRAEVGDDIQNINLTGHITNVDGAKDAMAKALNLVDSIETEINKPIHQA